MTINFAWGSIIATLSIIFLQMLAAHILLLFERNEPPLLLGQWFTNIWTHSSSSLPFTYKISDDVVGTLPKSEATFSAVFEDDNTTNEEDTDKTDNIEKLDAPNLEDITLVKTEIYYDQKKVPHMRFIFNVKNHVGDEVVGVYGKGG